MSLSDSYVETLTPSVMIRGGGAFGRCLGFDEVMRVGLPWWDQCSYKERKTSEEPPRPPQPGEDAARRWLSASQGVGPPQNQIFQHLDLGLQPPEVKNKCLLPRLLSLWHFVTAA